MTDGARGAGDEPGLGRRLLGPHPRVAPRRPGRRHVPDRRHVSGRSHVLKQTSRPGRHHVRKASRLRQASRLQQASRPRQASRPQQASRPLQASHPYPRSLLAARALVCDEPCGARTGRRPPCHRITPAPPKTDKESKPVVEMPAGGPAWAVAAAAMRRLAGRPAGRQDGYTARHRSALLPSGESSSALYCRRRRRRRRGCFLAAGAVTAGAADVLG